MRDRIQDAFEKAFSTLADYYKREYKVSRVVDYLLTSLKGRQEHPYPSAYKYLRSIVNTRSHGKDIDKTEFTAFVRKRANKPGVVAVDADKRAWIIADCNGKSRIAEKIIKLNSHRIVSNAETGMIERYDDAIGILRKYHSLDSCIVCDNYDFHGRELLSKKQNDRKRIYDGLDQKTRELLDTVVKDSGLRASDPFEIRRIVSEFIAGGDPAELYALQRNLNLYIQAIGDQMISALFDCFDGTSLYHDFDAYNSLVDKKPDFDSEELLFIEDVINENIGKDITIERDAESKNYKLKLGDRDLLGMDRGSMELSTGEQNFISLAFELLMARHSDKEYIVLDDPISSFDSIYKNKIAFCIIKFLENKKVIVLTHNLDLVRLLEVQQKGCFNLFILNNVENGRNGFIPVTEKEKGILINLHDLIKLFQNDECQLVPAIRNRRLFLMAMVPFMRGYAHISLDPDGYYSKISGIMHGYNDACVDVVPVYKKLFGFDFGGSEEIAVQDVLSLNCSDLDILDEEIFPLLSESLRQMLVYYFLRMKVEKVLVDAFEIRSKDGLMLGQVIYEAFKCRGTDPDFEWKRDFRVFFNSRKTLLNEFNHFEGNMNIFQPALDINPVALQKEVKDIEEKLIEVKMFAEKRHGH